MKWIVLCCTLLLPATVFAQEDVEITAVPQVNHDSLRALYIHSYPDHFFLWPVIKRRTLNFEISSQQNTDHKIKFEPNNSVAMGIGMYVFDIGFELTFAVPVDSKSEMIYGKTDAKDIQLNALSKKFGFDIYHQKYTGFYSTDSEIDLPKGSVYPQRSDIATRNFGVSGIYIFNDEEFSLRSAYTFAERQLRRKGSFLLTGTLNSFKLSADSSVLNVEQRASYGEASAFRDLQYTTFSVAPGYTYSLTYKNFFLNIALFIGPAHNWIYYTRNDDSSQRDISVNSFSSARIGVGYNSDRFFFGFNFVSQARRVKFEDVEFSNASNTFRFLFGYRFREFGILKKSIWNLPKEFLK